jgi:hypothetical protein
MLIADDTDSLSLSRYLAESPSVISMKDVRMVRDARRKILST